MEEKNIQHIVNLYLMFQKGIPNASRLHFQDLNRLLSPVIGPKKVEQAVQNYFSEQGRKILSSTIFLPLASSVRLLGTSRLLAKMLTNPEKVFCLGMLLKLLKDNNQEKNKEMLADIVVVAEIFGFKKKLVLELKDFYFDSFPSPELYSSSVILTSSQPDFNMAVDGLRFLWVPKAQVHIWFLNLHEAGTVLSKVLENNVELNVFSFKENDIQPFNEHFKIFLSQAGVNVDAVLSEINENNSFLPRVLIPPTELTPEVILDPIKKCIELNGHSLAVGTQKFFTPVFRWIEKLVMHPPSELSLNIRLNYFNTYTSKALLEIFLNIKHLESLGTKVTYNWYYMHDDPELLETGEHYEDILKVNFRFIELEGSELNASSAHE